MSWDAELRQIKRILSIAFAHERLKDRRLAGVIGLADMIAKESKALERDAHGCLTTEGVFSSQTARVMADLLLLMAYTKPEKLRNLGEAICRARRTDIVDLGFVRRAIALELVNAYEQCEPRDGLRPTIKELRDKFKDLSDESDWPGDFSAVRTLRGLNLKVAPSKRGRPINARSVMKELGQKKQSRNQKKINTQKR